VYELFISNKIYSCPSPLHECMQRQ